MPYLIEYEHLARILCTVVLTCVVLYATVLCRFILNCTCVGRGDYGRCLKNRPQAPSAMMLRRSGVAPQAMASRRPRVRHPGERYNASSQCQFLFGKEFKVCSYMVSGGDGGVSDPALKPINTSEFLLSRTCSEISC